VAPLVRFAERPVRVAGSPRRLSRGLAIALVGTTIQEKERLIYEAWADYNQTVPNARGEAERVVRAAEGYALERVNNARGDVTRFVNIYDEYRKALFYQRVTDERSAQSRLDDIVDGETRNVIASNDLIEVVRSTDRAFPETEENADVDMGTAAVAGKIAMGRDKITRAILDKSRHIVAEFGIELVDVQIRRVNYVAEVQQKVYDRMISERRRIAERSRSEGRGKAAEIRGQKERELKGIQSEAYRKAQEVMGKADGEATRIYAEAYGRDPELYQFLKTMETYRKALAPDTTLILSTDGEFFRYLKQSR
jgi:HflC protein